MAEAPFLSKSFLDELELRMLDHAKEIMEFMAGSMIDSKGLAWGDVPLGADERIAKYMDDEAVGVNERLRLSDPPEYARRLKEFQTDVRTRGLSGD